MFLIRILDFRTLRGINISLVMFDEILPSYDKIYLIIQVNHKSE